MDITVSEIASIWSRVLSRIKDEIADPMVYDSFFSGTYVNSVEGNKMVVVANSGLAATILDTKYRSLVDGIVKDITQSDYELVFVDASSVNKKEAKQQSQKSRFFADSRINPNHTFQNFVMGPSNLEAYQAALMVSKNPGQLYNPLLIYSDSGLGKTHLLHAIGNAIKQQSPNMRVLYVTTQDFFDEYVKYVQGQQEGESLKDFFRTSVDALLVDDIQFLVNKTGTEEMFFAVFSTMVSMGKQIVITSDQHPAQLKGLDERLKSRFTQGLPLSISRPDQATSEAILRQRIAANGMDVNDFDPEVITYFAQKFSTNVRELEGALNRLLFYIVNINPTKHITLDVAMDSVRGLIDVQDDKTKLSIEKIINTVADYYNLAPYQLTGRIRTSQIAMARHIAMYISRDLLDAPFTKIGDAFGGKDHATVMNGVSKVEKSMQENEGMKKAVTELEERLKS
jgi:chromosomal replication initiator protein